MSGIDLLYIDEEVPTIKNQDKTNETIYEWYPWSYFNVIFGCLVLGFVAIFFSFRTTMYKATENNVKARRWSRLTLIWNILATCTGVGLTLFVVLKR